MKLILPLLLLIAGCSGPDPPARPSAFLDVETLKVLPHVATVEVAPAKEPKRQIIHILNWHYVTFSEFKADLRTAEGEPPLTLQEVLLQEPNFSDVPNQTSAKWESFLQDVEAVQVEQMALLRLEGLAQDEMPAFRKRLGDLARWKKQKVDGPLDEFLIDMHRRDTLEVGASGRLMWRGNWKSCLPRTPRPSKPPTP